MKTTLSKRPMALLLSLLALALGFTSCEKEVSPNDTLEARVYSIQISNAGISGGDLIRGTVDEDQHTLTFENVPAETNIAAIRFSASLSLGAKLDAESYDFTEGNAADATTLNRTIAVVNALDYKGDNYEKRAEYQVTVKLAPAASAPLIDRIVCLDDQGVEHVLTSANVFDGIFCLGMPESSTATITSVSLLPLRATYTFTTIADGVISASNPGHLTLDFMGLTNDYEVNFASSPTPGADFSRAVVHDFSAATGSCYVDLEAEFTRGGDFNGEYVLLANRTAPKLFRTSDLLAGNASAPILLSTTGIEGGTHVVSAGRFAQGHIYLCNLATSVGDPAGANGPLKVYHYATPDATPEVVLTWDGTGVVNADADYTGRLGDNISIWLDEAGNGYAFFAKQEADNKIYRFTVTGFTQFSNPYEIALPAVANYYGMMNMVGPDQYLYTSSYVSMLWLFDHDGTLLRDFNWVATPSGADPTHACDPRVIEFARARYLVMTNSHRFAWWAPEQLFVFDISEGNDMVAAMVKMQEAQDAETLEPIYTYPMASGTISTACTALSGAAEVNGSLVLFGAAPKAGFVLVEVPKYK